MIFFDTTSASSWRHSSGLARVSRRLMEELGTAATPAKWPAVAGMAGRGDWILSPELFSEHERPGFSAFLSSRTCRVAAIFHDAIPVKHPSITWPKSVERHPGYMKLLSHFDRVWAVSAASRDDLIGFWKWQGVASPPRVDVLHLGADWKGVSRANTPSEGQKGPKAIVSIGILEPRKNQSVLLDAYGVLMEEGLEFELHLAGRVNPHFGGPIAQRVAQMAARWPGLHHHADLDDPALGRLVRSARATAFPSVAEGCGLPLLESLWMGVPCLCSDIAPLLENAAGGGCHVVRDNKLSGWVDALRNLVTDDSYRMRLAVEAYGRQLPTWSGATLAIRRGLE